MWRMDLKDRQLAHTLSAHLPLLALKFMQFSPLAILPDSQLSTETADTRLGLNL